MLSRRFRATVVMMGLWTVASAILSLVVAAVVIILSDSAGWREYFFLVGGMAPIFAVVGTALGAGFAGLLALRGADRGIDKLGARTGILWWAGLGAIVGSVSSVAAAMIRYGLPVEGIRLTQLLISGSIFGTIGAVVGTAVLAIAKRGKELPAEEKLNELSP